jgi:16S rRNA pseudouridine516 synthase
MNILPVGGGHSMKKTQRLDKILVHSGFGSRSEIKLLVKQGAVIINGKLIKDSGIQVNPEKDVILVSGELVKFREFVYIMLYKPQGVISATEDKRERTVLDLLDTQYDHFDIFPVGRLDKDTEGLLLLTNDGKLAHQLLSPKKHVPKTYYAEVEGCVDDKDIIAFRQGVTLDDGYVTMPAKLFIVTEGNPLMEKVSKVELTIMEGKFHQVKRMFASVGKKVVFLKRLCMGTLFLDEALAPGEYRELTALELEGLQEGPNE